MEDAPKRKYEEETNIGSKRVKIEEEDEQKDSSLDVLGTVDGREEHTLLEEMHGENRTEEVEQEDVALKIVGSEEKLHGTPVHEAIEGAKVELQQNEIVRESTGGLREASDRGEKNERMEEEDVSVPPPITNVVWVEEEEEEEKDEGPIQWRVVMNLNSSCSEEEEEEQATKVVPKKRQKKRKMMLVPLSREERKEKMQVRASSEEKEEEQYMVALPEDVSEDEDVGGIAAASRSFGQCSFEIHEECSAIVNVRSWMLYHLDDNRLPVVLPDEHQGCAATLRSMLERTIVDGDSNSVLVSGPRGSGKTVMIEFVMRELERKFTQGNTRRHVVVRLNGTVQTTSREALWAITRQLLPRNERGKEGSFAECLDFLLSCLRQTLERELAIFFVLDEFDMFARHPKQTLLYSLLDTLQARGARMAVVGVTCQLDCLELLEKRVRSRFSNRQLHMNPPASLRDVLFPLMKMLQVQDTPVGNVLGKKESIEFDRAVLAAVKGAKARAFLRARFEIVQDPRALRVILRRAVHALSEDHPLLTADDIVAACEAEAEDDKQELIKGLSVLELSLVIALSLVQSKHGMINFAIAFEEYTRFSAIHGRSVDAYSRSVAFKAFTHLERLELIQCMSKNPSVPSEFCTKRRILNSKHGCAVSMQLNLTPVQIKQAVSEYVDCPTLVRRWASRL